MKKQINWLRSHLTLIDDYFQGTRALPWVSDIKCVRIMPPKSSQRRPKITIQCPSNRRPVFCPKNNCNSELIPTSTQVIAVFISTCQWTYNTNSEVCKCNNWPVYFGLILQVFWQVLLPGARCPASPNAGCVQYKCQSCGAVFFDKETLYPVSCLGETGAYFVRTLGIQHTIIS